MSTSLLDFPALFDEASGIASRAVMETLAGKTYQASKVSTIITNVNFYNNARLLFRLNISCHLQIQEWSDGCTEKCMRGLTALSQV